MSTRDPAPARKDLAAAAPWDAVLGVLVVVVFGLLLWTLNDFLNPFLLWLLLLGLLLPFRRRPGHTLVAVLVTLLTLLWVLATTGFLLAPFVLALVLAYVLDPAVDRLERRMPRAVAILLLALPVLGAVAAALFLGLPAVGRQAVELLDRVPSLIDRVPGWVDALERQLTGLGLPPSLQEGVGGLREVDADAVVTFLQERREDIVRRVWDAVLGVGRGLGSALTVLGYVVLTPVLTFYLLRDWDGLTAAAADLVPERERDRVLGFAREYDRLLSRYLRGQLLVAVIVGTITTLGLWIAGFPYALLLGVLVAVFGLVPYLGLVLSLIPALVIAVLTPEPVTALITVVVVYGVAQILEGSVISPRVVGESVGLHPVWVVLALAVGGFYFGFVGLLIGVPLAVGVKLLAQRVLHRYRRSSLYGGVRPEPGGTGASRAGF